MTRTGLPIGFQHSELQQELIVSPVTPEEEEEPGGIRLTPSKIEWLGDRLRSASCAEDIFEHVPEIYGLEAELAMLGRATANSLLSGLISTGLSPYYEYPFPQEMVPDINSQMANLGFYNGDPFKREALAISLYNYLRGAYYAQIGTLGHRLVELITHVLTHQNTHSNRIDETLQLVLPKLPEEQSIAVGDLIRQQYGRSDLQTKVLLADNIFRQIVQALEVDDGRLLTGNHIMQMIRSHHTREFLDLATRSWLPRNQLSKRLVLEIIKSGQLIQAEASCSLNLVIPDGNTEHKLQVPSRYDLLAEGTIIDYKLFPETASERTRSALLVDLLYLWGGRHLLKQGRAEGGVYYSPATQKRRYTSLYHTPIHNVTEQEVTLYHVPLAAKPGKDFVHPHNLTPEEYNLALESLLFILRLERERPTEIRGLLRKIDSGYCYPHLPGEEKKSRRKEKPTFLDAFDQLPFHEA